jgi:LysM repeat protein
LAVSPVPAPATNATSAVASVAATQGAGPVPARIPVAGADSAHPHTYVVQAKDNIYSVANRYGLKVSAILAVNPNVSPTRLRIGQSLNLP